LKFLNRKQMVNLLEITSPSPGFRSRGSRTTRDLIFKYNIGCMQQQGVRHEMGGKYLK